MRAEKILVILCERTFTIWQVWQLKIQKYEGLHNHCTIIICLSNKLVSYFKFFNNFFNLFEESICGFISAYIYTPNKISFIHSHSKGQQTIANCFSKFLLFPLQRISCFTNETFLWIHQNLSIVNLNLKLENHITWALVLKIIISWDRSEVSTFL